MRPHTTRRLALAATLALGAAVIPAATAAAVQDPIPIGPNTYFYGLVGDKAADAVIQVVCPGPVGPTSTGHPVSGQTAEVRSVVPPVTSQYGYTGSAAHQIDAGLTLPSSATVNPPIVFTSFFAPAAIPTTWVVPCGGTTTMTFVPLATSTTARSYTLTVAFVNIAA
ncbi:hypothetical protein [Catenulispora subtropica]|uniref:Secreted protein n=1 Tax=Catenulispora subtropica TaxID=450798 RepID=A0ABN2S9Q6_9ACTN